MAYDVTEERLKVRGSEQITRDLKVNRDAFINGTTDTKNLTVEDDVTVKGEAIFEDDVAIHGDLYVEGTTTTTSEAQVSSSGNYVVTRDNNSTPLATGEYSGLAVNNYATGKIATITADKDGTWRISDSATATATTYTNISAYNGVYYTGLSQTTTTGPTGILTNVDADELASVVLNGSSYYHKAGNDWFGPITLVNNALDIGSIVTDTTLIATLNGLTKNDLVYYRSAIDKTIDASTNQPLLTRAESSNLTGGQAFTWDATNEKAVGKTIDTTVTANSSNLITSGAVKTAVDTAEANAKNLANATGTLAIAHGGTGQTTAQAIVDETIQAGIGDATGDVMNTTAIITTNNEGYSTADKRLYRRPATALWSYIKSKLSSIFGLGATKTDNAIVRWDGTDGKLQNSGITINDDNTIVFPTVSGTGGRTLIQQAVGGNDVFRIKAGSTASDSGYGEIATGDNGNEPIYVRQYSGPFSEPTSVRTATLLDESGNTSFPGTVTASFSGNLSGNASTATRANNAYSINGQVSCDTAAATAAKTVSLPGFSLTKGSKLIVNVSNANTAASALTLNVNGTGAKTIRVNGAVTSSTSHSLSAGLYNCYYDGTYWNMDNGCEALNARNANYATESDWTRSTAYCTTAAGTAAKTASMRGYVLSNGIFPITFTTTNTVASALTLNINSTGAKPIYINGTASSSTNHTLPAGTYLCIYNGTSYDIHSSLAGGATVTGVKGNSETTYRTGDVNITKANIGLGSVVDTGDSASPVNGGNTKFTTGGAYNFFGGNTTASAWLTKVFGLVLGRTWTQGTGATTYTIPSVYYANSIWVAGSNHGLWWSTNGKAWTQGTGSMTSYAFYSVYYANGIWVAGSYNQGLWWSTDGKAWTQGTGATTYTFYKVHYANGIWVAGSNNHGLWWSTNGKTWTQGTGATTYTSSSVYYANGIWVSGSHYGLWWSTDGKAWTQGTGDMTNYSFYSAYYANGIWVAGSNSHGLWWSNNGKAWTQCNDATTGTTRAVYYANSLWVAGSDKGPWWSTDGKNWTQGVGISDSELVYYANGVWVMSADRRPPHWSMDGKSWNRCSSVTNGGRSIYYANGIWVVGTSESGLWWSSYDNIEFQ